jgi:hypothetical protein
MRDLTVLNVSDDGRSLTLADSKGGRYRLAVDDRLRAALRPQRPGTEQTSIPMATQLTPREIQARVRRGASVDVVAESAGIPLERVRRFAAPVLDERAHVAQRARGVLVRDDSMLELGTLEQVVQKELTRRGASETLEWDAWRREDGRWLIVCRWREEHECCAASWVLDASGGSATPLDDGARGLAGLLRDAPGTDETHARPARLAVVPDRAESAPQELVDVDGAPEGSASEADETPTGPVPVLTPHPADARDIEDTGVLRLTDIADNVTTDEPPPTPHRTSSGRNRPAVPSWDEIMFGRRT